MMHKAQNTGRFHTPAQRAGDLPNTTALKGITKETKHLTQRLKERFGSQPSVWRRRSQTAA